MVLPTAISLCNETFYKVSGLILLAIFSKSSKVAQVLGGCHALGSEQQLRFAFWKKYRRAVIALFSGKLRDTMPLLLLDRHRAGSWDDELR